MENFCFNFVIDAKDQRCTPYRLLSRSLNSLGMRIVALLFSGIMSTFFVFFLYQTYAFFPSGESIIAFGAALYFGFYAYEAVVICKGKIGRILPEAQFLQMYLTLASTDDESRHYTVLLNEKGIVINDIFVAYADIEKVETPRDGYERFTVIVLKHKALDLLWWHAPRTMAYSQYHSGDILLLPLEACTEQEREQFFSLIRAHTPLGTVQILS